MPEIFYEILQFVLVSGVCLLAVWTFVDLNRNFPADPQELSGVHKWRGRMMWLIALLACILVGQMGFLVVALAPILG